VADRRDVVVVGGGHNGLVAGCYLARAGFDVEVIERDTVLGGAVSTVERWPGVHVDRGSTMHVMIRHTGIVEELELADCGLDYVDADPWAVAVYDDKALRFAVDVADTCASINEACGPDEAAAYRRFVDEWSPRLDAMLAAFHRRPTAAGLARAFWPLGRRHRVSGGELARAFLQPADAVLDHTFTDERLRTALAWWAAQAGPATSDSATSPLLATALLMHRRAPGRPRGGSGALTAALARRLTASGGTVTTGDAVATIDAESVTTVSGRRIDARAVVCATHVLTALQLLGDEALMAAAQSRLRVGPGLGMVLRVLTDRLPRYPAAPIDVHTAMQFVVRSRDQLRAAHAAMLQGECPVDPPLLVMTPTATDQSLAPSGQHVVSIWTQWHPRRLREQTWESVRNRETDRLVAALDAAAPGFAAAVRATHLQTPEDLERELGLPNGNVLHLDMTLDAMFALRPLPEWSGYLGPRGVYLCGASTHPGGGVWGASGRSVADLVERTLHGARWRGPHWPARG
jgi:phytoene dehydrogenase-like protein